VIRSFEASKTNSASSSNLPNKEWAYALVAFALVVLLLPITQRAALRCLFKLLRKEALVIEEGPGAYVRQTLGYGLAWILLGTSLFVLRLGFAQGASISVWLLAIEAYVIAGVAGMVSVIVPSGIGVREGVMALGLTPLLGLEQSIVAAILARVTISLAELIGILAGFVYLERHVTGEPPGPGRPRRVKMLIKLARKSPQATLDRS